MRKEKKGTEIDSAYHIGRRTHNVLAHVIGFGRALVDQPFTIRETISNSVPTNPVQALERMPAVLTRRASQRKTSKTPYIDTVEGAESCSTRDGATGCHNGCHGTRGCLRIGYPC